jgi:hypothetical protein
MDFVADGESAVSLALATPPFAKDAKDGARIGFARFYRGVGWV